MHAGGCKCCSFFLVSDKWVGRWVDGWVGWCVVVCVCVLLWVWVCCAGSKPVNMGAMMGHVLMVLQKHQVSLRGDVAMTIVTMYVQNQNIHKCINI